MKVLNNVIQAVWSANESVKTLGWKSWVFIFTILFGSMGIATTFTIRQNMDNYVEDLVNRDGGPTVTIFNQSPNLKFSDTDLQKFKNISVIKKAYATDSADAVFRLGSESTHIDLKPITKENWLSLPFKIKSGEMISPLEGARASAQVILSPGALAHFGLFSHIGSSIAAKLKSGEEIFLTIAGIGEPLDAQMDQGMAWVSLPLYKVITGRRSLMRLKVVSKDTQGMDWIETFGREVLKPKFGNNIFVSNPLSYFLERKRQLGVFLTMGYYLGIVALLAGSIGSTSVMVLNIGLRRREIGLYKAIGFSSPIILFQFICETLILSLVGGFLGGLSGCALGYYVSVTMFTIATLSMTGLSVGLGSAVLVGLIFGFFPALVAARMDPVEALHS